MEVLEGSLSDVPLLRVRGEVDHLSASALDEVVQKLLDSNGARLLVDLAECPYLDSGGLSVILSAVREVRGKGWLGVVAPNENLIRLFEIVGLTINSDFRIFAGQDEAAEALAGMGRLS